MDDKEVVVPEPVEVSSDTSDTAVKKDSKPAVDHDDDMVDALPLREFRVVLPGLSEPVSFNPLVSLIGVVLLWGLSVWSMVDPENSSETLIGWRNDVALNFTWLFVASRAVFVFYLIYVGIKFGGVKLGRADEKPEFDDASYFAMIFAAGVAVGLFVYGVSEPLYHQGSHWYANAGYHSQDEVDQYAILLTVNNWALAGWAPYLIVAVSMALAGHRFNLPMTFRSCFYPILGEYTWGWVGDAIDGITIVVTVAGVCTSLGLGALQIVAGFQYLGWVDEDISSDKTTTIANLTIWGITCISTASVMSGLNVGIKILSSLAFLLGMFLLGFVFIFDDTKYVMNLVVQTTGLYLQKGIVELNFWTDAFAQLLPGTGRAVDGNAGATWWMGAWLIFYQAWWVSWSAFVGLFVARISRGRTVGSVILYSMVVPILYCIIWFGIWGGIGIRQSRQADELIVLGETYFNDTAHYLVPGSTVCYDVPQSQEFDEDGNVIFTNLMKGVTPVCKFDSSRPDFSAFNVLYSYSFPDDFDTGYGPFLTVVFIFSLAIYFATSSDSGSLVVDHLSANGRKHHHWIQRLFWAVTEGAVATAILSAGGSQGLQAVQAASIVFGLPFNFMMIYLIQSIQLFCQRAAESVDALDYSMPSTKSFSVPVYGGVFNICEWLASLGNVHEDRVSRGMDKPTNFHVVEFLKGCFVPFLSLHQVLSAAYPRNTVINMLNTAVYAAFYYTWIALFVAYSAKTGLIGMGWLFFFCAATLLGAIRSGFRSRYNVRSNVLADFITSMFFWPQVLTQMRQHCEELGLPNDKMDEDEMREVDDRDMEGSEVVA